MDAEQLAKVDDVMAIPYGIDKVPAVLASVHAGLVTSIVTHDALAQALLTSTATNGSESRRRR